MTERRILGIKFFSGSAAGAVNLAMRGGLVVVPSAPVLVDIESKQELRRSVIESDLAITDSGLMVLLWRLLTREKLERVSGLEYLQLLLIKLKELGVRRSMLSGKVGEPLTPNTAPITENAGGIFWVMPTVEAQDRNLAWLQSTGHRTTVADCYVAPVYSADGPLEDPALFEQVRQSKPAHIIIALGGGVQERLGFALREALKADSKAQGIDPRVSVLRSQVSTVEGYRPGIHCIGAAIGFLSGEQVNIPPWADYFYLGWLFRSLSEPAKFIPRYWKAKRLVWLMWRYRANSPGVPKN